MSLGLGAPQKGHRDVQDGLAQTIAAAAKFGKAIGLPIGQPWGKVAKHYIDMGCRFLEIGHELNILASGWKPAASEFGNVHPSA